MPVGVFAASVPSLFLIPEEILSVGIKARIENRCNQDKNSFRINYLTSELFVYDKLTRNQEIILKK